LIHGNLRDALRRIRSEYLLGIIGEEKTESAIASMKSEYNRCDAYFYAMWYSELNNKRSLAEEFRNKMLDVGYYCAENFVCATKFGFVLNPSEASSELSPK
jgi:hypothetical protein